MQQRQINHQQGMADRLAKIQSFPGDVNNKVPPDRQERPLFKLLPEKGLEQNLSGVPLSR